MANCDAAEEDFGLPVLLASSDWAWTGWHVDRDPGADVASQLQRGTKLWFFESRERESRQLTHANKGDMRGVVRSLPSILLDDLKRNHRIQFCVQNAGDVVFFPAKTCHCVLSGPGSTSLLTVTFEGSPDEMELSRKKLIHRQATGKRKAVGNPGARMRGRGQKRRRFSKIEVSSFPNRIPNSVPRSFDFQDESCVSEHFHLQLQ